MKIEEPITTLKAHFDKDELEILDKAQHILDNLYWTMYNKHFATCYCQDYEDVYEVDKMEVETARLILIKLQMLNELG